MSQRCLDHHQTASILAWIYEGMLEKKRGNGIRGLKTPKVGPVGNQPTLFYIKRKMPQKYS